MRQKRLSKSGRGEFWCVVSRVHRKGTLYEPRARRTLEHPTIVKQQGSKLMSASAQQVSLPLSLETDSTTTALALVTHINAACDPFSSESWPSLCDIKACRNVNGMRHAFAIRDVCGSGNPVLRRGGDHAVRVSGRKTTVTFEREGNLWDQRCAASGASAGMRGLNGFPASNLVMASRVSKSTRRPLRPTCKSLIEESLIPLSRHDFGDELQEDCFLWITAADCLDIGPHVPMKASASSEKRFRRLKDCCKIS
jgi:hypothetical protein